MESIETIRTLNFAASNNTGADVVLADYVPQTVKDVVKREGQKAFPLISKDKTLCKLITEILPRIPTTHKLYLADNRKSDFLKSESAHLVLTSPPYWNLKTYLNGEGQLGIIDDFDEFVDELDNVWRHALRVLVPGGRLIIVVGDVCVPRSKYGRHIVFPLHAVIQDRCRGIGFDNLAPIIWHKITNARFEVPNGGGFLGKPFEPNAIIKNDIEYIIFQRKPGGYRSPTTWARALSTISESNYKEWFQQIWRLPGASTKQHPAPFPYALADRLIRMFSFVNDIVIDPFMGSGTTNVAARFCGRNSIGIEVEREYYENAYNRLLNTLETQDVLFDKPSRGS